MAKITTECFVYCEHCDYKGFMWLAPDEWEANGGIHDKCFGCGEYALRISIFKKVAVTLEIVA